MDTGASSYWNDSNFNSPSAVRQSAEHELWQPAMDFADDVHRHDSGAATDLGAAEPGTAGMAGQTLFL